MEKDILYKDITGKIIGAAMEVHKVLGPGFLEGVYEEAFCIELDRLGLKYKRQEELKIPYKEYILKQRYRADLIVEDKVIVDNKATKAIVEIDRAQVFNYLKATRLKVGLIINFGELSLKWKRIICEKYFR
ncbi:MAG: GxxExxY protein [Candidatus Auribacterota bacterium]|nr:GxxExxY protein [Candidatus Auribacterota bacterium]